MQLPLDIFYYIVEQICAADHSLSYSTDTRTLLALCLVNRDLNAIATRHLYSSITLSTVTAVQKLANTALGPSRYILFCNSLAIESPSGTIDSFSIISAASGLRRLYVRGIINSHNVVACSPILAELVLPEGTYQPLLEPGPYNQLQRLALFDVFFQATQVVDCLVSLPSLTHLALSDPVAQEAFDRNGIHQPDALRCFVGLINYLMRKRPASKVILGLNVRIARPMDHIFMFRRYLEHHFAGVGLVFIEYGPARLDRSAENWFYSRIMDGTIWEMTH